MKNSKYRISFTVLGEANLGTVIAAMAGEVSDIQIIELEREPKHRTLSTENPNRQNQREAWVKKYIQVVLSCLTPSVPIHYKAIGAKVESATNGGIKRTSITPILTELVRAGHLTRTGDRGMYKLP